MNGDTIGREDDKEKHEHGYHTPIYGRGPTKAAGTPYQGGGQHKVSIALAFLGHASRKVVP